MLVVYPGIEFLVFTPTVLAFKEFAVLIDWQTLRLLIQTLRPIHSWMVRGTRHKDPHLERVIALTVNIVHYMFWILCGVDLSGVDGFKRWLDVNLRQ